MENQKNKHNTEVNSQKRILPETETPKSKRSRNSRKVMLNEIQNHEIDSGFRLVECFHYKCQIKKPLKELLIHFKNEHKFTEAIQTAPSTYEKTLEVPKSILVRRGTIRIPIYIKHNGYDFFVELTRTIIGKWYLWIRILGSQKCAEKVKYRITFFNKEEKSVHMYCRNLISIDTPHMDILRKKGSTLAIHDFMVQNTHKRHKTRTLRSRTLETQRISFKITMKNK